MPGLLGTANTSGIASSTAAPSVLDRRLRTSNGTPFSVMPFPEAAGCDFGLYEPVILSTESCAPLATIPAALAVSSSVADGQKVIGWALAQASGTTGNVINVALATDVMRALGFVYAAAAANAQEQDIAVGDVCELFRYLAATGTKPVTFCSAAVNGTDGINSAYCAEKFGGPSGKQPAATEYAAIWYNIRATLRQF